jgi:hypothetical protein
MAGRIRTIISDGGYRYLSDGHPRQDTSALVLEHRLTAVAWGLIDGLDDEREVYPADSEPCHIAEKNLRTRLQQTALLASQKGSDAGLLADVARDS